MKLVSDSSPEMSLSDDALLGRNLVVGRIFARHYEALLRYLRRKLDSQDEASDLAQEAYLRLCRQRDLDKLEEGERSYLFKVATNLLRDRYRRRATRNGARHLVFEQVVQPRAVEEDTPQDLLEYKQTLALVKTALLEMDPKLRRVFLMRRLRRTPYREIAERLGVSERTVERYMHGALRLLKQELVTAAPAPRLSGGVSK
ncbi:MAG: sigma-70 family RNA polymerase sigma factor [bacterium]|nr:sigma-70 family RNA polymerase sigma factor [bacterium]